MLARVTTYRGRVEQLAGGLEQTRDVLATKPGCRGVEYLIDTRGGVALTTRYWESAEAADATSEWAERARRRTTEAMGLTVEDVRVFDVALRADLHPKR